MHLQPSGIFLSLWLMGTLSTTQGEPSGKLALWGILSMLHVLSLNTRFTDFNKNGPLY